MDRREKREVKEHDINGMGKVEMDGWMCGQKRHISIDQTLMHNDREGNHGG